MLESFTWANQKRCKPRKKLLHGGEWPTNGRAIEVMHNAACSPAIWSPRPMAWQMSLPRRLFTGLIIFGVIFLLLAGGAAYSYFTFSGPLSQIVGQRASCAKNGVGVNSGRLNILLLGSDNDEKFQGQPLAQTDIVITIDPAAKTVGMLSIPRDFFLNVPGYGMHKLDEAYSLGGVALSCQTIEQDFGIPLNYYAWVGLDGFINVINTMGGVDIDVIHAIVDDNYPDDINNKNDPYALQRLYIAPGPQHLDGQQALEYVRSRHADLVGDFGRSARQQQVLLALKNKLDNATIFSKLPTIANELKGSVKTDMQLSDVLQVMNFARELSAKNIQRLVLGPPYSTAGVAPGNVGTDAGVSVVFPDCTKILAALQQLFGQSIQPMCNIEGNPGVSLRLYSSSVATVPWMRPGRNSVAVSHILRPADDITAGVVGGPADLFGWRSMLDIQLLAVFESPEVFQT